MTIKISFTHTSTNSSSAKLFSFGFDEDSIISEKIPNQLQQIINCISLLSDTQSTFTYNDIINFIDELSLLDNHTFTHSKGGTERIVRYYGKQLQNLNVLIEPQSVDTELDFND